MKGLRNPFRLRRAESIDTDDAFLTLFEPGILEILPEDTLWDSVHIVRSAAGGGKTSLIRLFTPTSLIALWRRGKSDPKTRELYQRMKDFCAIDDSGPCALGVLLACGPGYSILEDLDVDQGRKDRLFFGLLNARISLAVLRGVVQFSRLGFPDGLNRIQITSREQMPILQGIEFPCTGAELYRWAESREAALCETLDSLGPLRAESLPGDETLYSLNLLKPANITMEGALLTKRILLMMDDVHNLTARQRNKLVSTVIDARSNVGVWIAERFDALTAQEMLSSGAEKGRDYSAVIAIESFWRAKPEKFEKLAVKVADRRINDASDTNVSSFRSCLQESLSDDQWDQRFAQIAEIVASRLKANHGNKGRFREWIRLREETNSSPRERATEWRALEILIERELSRSQRWLFDDMPLGEVALGEKQDSSLLNAAELFLAREYDIPYYFGVDRVARLASLNIQQFLGIGGEIFEEAAAAELLRKTLELPPARQHALIKQMARQVWDEIPNKVRHGRELRRFIESIGKFSQAYTYRPTAPNDPGVTGTAIRMSERAQLVREAEKPSQRNQGFVRLGDILALALSHNLLVAQLDYNCKQEKWMVLNLNRLLCVHFDLPLGYGLYKERPLKTLIQWLDRPYVEPASGVELL